LRKESRRHLRVTFRPDASLVDVRYFHHDPEEELGHEENFVRDAGDIGGEGRMFKQHRDMEMDEDEEEAEVDYRPWQDVSEVDFSRVDEEDRKRNYAPYGGGQLQAVSAEAEANRQHENATLMVIYSHPSDIPSSPREPLTPLVETPSKWVEFGSPPDKVLARVPKTAAPAPAQDFSALFEAVKKLTTTNPPPAQSSIAPVTYASPAPAVPAVPNLSAIMSALGGGAPAAPMPQTQPVGNPVPPIDINALLSGLQMASAQGMPIPPPPVTWPTSFPQAFGQAQPQQPDLPSYQQHPQQGQQPPAHDNQGQAGSKRQRNDEDNHSGYGSFKRGKFRNNANGQDRQVPHKVIACKFWKLGKCTKGDDCTFIHEQ
jgi:hypothetical protein